MIRIETTLNVYFSLHLEKGSTIAKVSVIHRHICVHIFVFVLTFGNHKSFKRHQLWIEDLLRKNRWCPFKNGGLWDPEDY